MENDRIKIKEIEILSDEWYTLKRGKFLYRLENGEWQPQSREAYDRGNGVAILLYHSTKKTVILTRQFRFPTYINQHDTGMMIEVPAGMLEEEDPEACVIREVEEETGYRIKKADKVFESYMSPGAVTEILHFFTADYSQAEKIHPGGGHPEETENIEVLEVEAETAIQWVESGKIRDAKTIMLLQYGRLKNLI
ncbi:NUDIX domain-containing protein [Robertkochia aurantiaca]|uniref:NUDIX domain-containing protein n=1 Tax=Robertkochia aurantiaca TaxID=2873700 RepID=UPI001CCD1B01|nr:NUDIX domain-containing protein [Robertkochia sp. 3YJGBD-33]